MKWEYFTKEYYQMFYDSDGLQAALNKVGAEGWEFVVIIGETFIFKRVIQESVPKMSFRLNTGNSTFPGLDSDK